MAISLVTGATGFVGANVARLLLEKGRKVRVLVRATSDRGNIANLDVEIATGDLRDKNTVDAAVKGCDEVYHVAAEYSFWSQNPQEMYNSNIQGTKNILDACLKHHPSKVVYTSTVGAIGLKDQPRPCNETTLMDPGQLTSHYKRSKFEAERAALGYVSKGVPLVIVNPSAPIGPWDRKPTPTGKMIVDFVQGTMPAYVDTGLNFVHVRDVATGHLLAAEKGSVGERYILGNRNLSLAEFLKLVAKYTGKPSPKIRIPYAVAWAAGFVSTKFSDWVTHRPPAIPLESVKMSKRYMYFDCAKAVRELNLPQTPVENAVKDAVDWFAGHGYFKA